MSYAANSIIQKKIREKHWKNDKKWMQRTAFMWLRLLTYYSCIPETLFMLLIICSK